MDHNDSKLGAGIWRTEYHVRGTPSRIIPQNAGIRPVFLTCNHFAVIYKNKAESLISSLPPFIIIENLSIYRVFFTHSKNKVESLLTSLPPCFILPITKTSLHLSHLLYYHIVLLHLKHISSTLSLTHLF